MTGSMKVAIGLCSVAVVIGIVSLIHPLPLVAGLVGAGLLTAGTATGLVSLFHNGQSEEES